MTKHAARKPTITTIVVATRFMYHANTIHKSFSKVLLPSK